MSIDYMRLGLMLLLGASELARAGQAFAAALAPGGSGFGLRMPDGGPIYVETIKYLNSQDQGLIWEPYNSATALLFALVAVYWLFKIRGQDRVLFFRISMVILLIGSMGGTLYHAFRSSRWFLMMDVMPIMLLIMGSVGWMLSRMLRRSWLAWLLAVAGLGGTIALYLGIRKLGLSPFGFSTGYLMIAVYVLIPYIIYLRRTRWAGVRHLVMATVFFLSAFAFRSLDRGEYLPMGTHFLWHIFGALAAASLVSYLWRTRLIDPAKKTGDPAKNGADPVAEPESIPGRA